METMNCADQQQMKNKLILNVTKIIQSRKLGQSIDIDDHETLDQMLYITQNLQTRCTDSHDLKNLIQILIALKSHTMIYSDNDSIFIKNK